MLLSHQDFSPRLRILASMRFGDFGTGETSHETTSASSMPAVELDLDRQVG